MDEDEALPPLDDIGRWSETKLQVIQEYAVPCSRILAKKGFRHIYIDGFAGKGMHVSRKTGAIVRGSPLRVLDVNPPFAEYHFVERDAKSLDVLRRLVGTRPNVFLYEGDCNEVLPKQVFPRLRADPKGRAFCLLDPYGIHVQWEVVRAAGQLGTVDLLLHFSMLDMNLNVLLWDPDRVSSAQAARMNAFWGDDTWKKAAYGTGLFASVPVKQPNEAVARAFAERLRTVGGFAHVVENPLPMRNSKGATVYYLFFASKQPVAVKIASDIFRKHAKGGA